MTIDELEVILSTGNLCLFPFIFLALVSLYSICGLQYVTC